MNNFGYYGKNVHRGDFVRFNLPRGFVTVWDDWLQQLMRLGEETHGSQWSERYASSAGHWFALSTGIAGRQAWGGVLVPSVDKVGRLFPFCLAAALPDELPPIQGPGQLRATYQALDEIITGINAPELNFDEVQNRLAELGDKEPDAQAPILEEGSETDARTTTPDAQIQVRVDGHSILDSVAGLTSLLDATLEETVFQHSVWISRDSGEHAGTFLSSGLPLGRSGVALFDGDWASSGSRRITRSVVFAPEQIKDGDSTDTVLSSNTRIPPVTEAAVPPHSENPLDESEWSAPSSAAVNASSEVESEMMSTGDWTDFETSVSTDEPRIEAPPVPTIEPLEIDEDIDEPAPWDP